MKSILIFLVLILSQVLFAESNAWLDKAGKPIKNSDSTKSINDFGGWLIVTPDLDWKEKWETPAETTPHFNTASKVNYGESLTILIFYANPKKGSSGFINILCDIKVTRPDGSHSINAKDVTCATGKLEGPAKSLRLSLPVIKYTGEENDLPGIWKVEVNLTDKIRNVNIPLKTQFELLEKKGHNK